MTAAIETGFSGRIGLEPRLKTAKARKPWLSIAIAICSSDDAQWLQVAVAAAVRKPVRKPCAVTADRAA